MTNLLKYGVAVAAVVAFGSTAIGSAEAQEKKSLAFVVNAASDFWKLAEAGVKKAGRYYDFKTAKGIEEQKAKLFATGLERGNSIVGHMVMSTLFLREHNNICDELFGFLVLI